MNIKNINVQNAKEIKLECKKNRFNVLSPISIDLSLTRNSLENYFANLICFFFFSNHTSSNRSNTPTNIPQEDDIIT